MLTDLAEASHPEDLSCDICIVGAGAAGITLAKSLAGSSLNVIVLESGGLKLDKFAQGLNAGTAAGAQRLPLTATRLRYLGGTTNHWTGIVAPLFRDDFERVSIAGVPGWPIEPNELEPFYQQSLQTIDFEDMPAASVQSAFAGRCDFPFDNERIRQSLLYYSPAVRFGDRYRDAIEKSSNVHLVLNATVTELFADAKGSHVRQVRAEGEHKRSLTVRAKRFVLACGAVENARQMLAYQDKAPDSPIDPEKQSGRFLMDHPTAVCGRVVPTGNVALTKLFPDFTMDKLRIRPVLSLPAATIKAMDTANASLYLWPGSESRSRLDRLTGVFKGASDQQQRAELSRRIDSLAPASQLPCEMSAENAAHLQLKAVLEQSPHADNRVTLGSSKDELGMRLPHLEWRVHEQEYEALKKLVLSLGSELGRLAAGRVQLSPWMLDGLDAMNQTVEDYNHPVGCTRMSMLAKDGVVNAECRVHGSDNLYIAGGSVFSTAGINNPTLTIVALAHRLAEHLLRS